jgi:hypothetical protein
MPSQLIDEFIQLQRKKLLTLAQGFVPGVTEEDLLQPNDFPELELNPHFRYEEGFLHALLALQSSLAFKRGQDEME